jgi:agmatinase
MRRIRELGVATAHVGVRSISQAEHEYVEAHSVPVAWWLGEEGADRDEFDRVLGTLGEIVYVSVDIDVLDPALVPGTGTPEPGGLSWSALCRLLRRVCTTKTVVGCDIVEVVPVPGSKVSEYVAARLGAKVINYHHRAAGGGEGGPGR